jgi:Uma2 family endonuclease
MSDLQTPPRVGTWVAASWEDYLRTQASLSMVNTKGYYYKSHMRLEMLPVGFDHGNDHVVIIFAVNLFAALKGIAATGLDTTTFRQTGVRECQPDVAYYLGDRARAIPPGTGIVNLDQYPAPDLVIEVAKTSLLDDIGTKRALYEELGVSEYWVLDVQAVQILAYRVDRQGSQRTQTSQVLPGLTIAILEEALQRSREVDQSQVGSWLLSQFQQP